jgi:hypothetical protein
MLTTPHRHRMFAPTAPNILPYPNPYGKAACTVVSYMCLLFTHNLLLMQELVISYEERSNH